MNPRPTPRRTSLVGALLLATLLSGAAAPRPTPPSLDLPIRDVTVFSDRARVLRRGEVTLEAGERRVRLPLLPATLRPDSVRLEATGARVVRLEISPVDRADFPRTEALRLIDEVERLQDEERLLVDEKEPLDRERALLLGLRFNAVLQPNPQGPPVLLDPAGWRISLAFVDAREASLRALIVPLELKLEAKRKELAAAAERAARLASDTTSRPGFRADAVVDGRGKATLSLTYVAQNARWYPTYDVRAIAGDPQVDLDLAGLVAQETGEDWTDARLVLSTAVPATTPTLPRLATWKISDRERFIPTPRAAPDHTQPRPPLPPVPMPIVEADSDSRSDDSLRQTLYALAANTPRQPRAPSPSPMVAADMGGGSARRERAYKAMPSAPMPTPAPAMEMDMMVGDSDDGEASYEEAPEAPRMMAETALSASPGMFRGRNEPAPQRLPFGAPPGWVMPSFAADLPASLAGGYDFTLTSARSESIASGAGPQRVALGTRRLPAASRLQVFPALRKDAFLVAEVTNNGDTPLLRGRANVFSGSDLQGNTLLPTTATGEKVTVSLGVDEAIAVQRQVQVIEGERGLVFGKQDVATYEVTIELLNPRPRAVVAQVRDQVPLTADKDNVEVKFESAEFGAKPDAATGLLEWTVELSPGQKRLLKFRYSLSRPRGWRPYDTHTPMEQSR